MTFTDLKFQFQSFPIIGVHFLPTKSVRMFTRIPYRHTIFGLVRGGESGKIRDTLEISKIGSFEI
jgi:hypothetical protein